MATRRSPMSVLDKVKFLYLYDKGIKIKELSKYFDRDPSTLFRILQQCGRPEKEVKKNPTIEGLLSGDEWKLKKQHMERLIK